MSDLEKAARVALELRQLANKFSEGWHDGIKIDASDVMLLAAAAAALEEQAEPVVERINAGPVGYRYKYPDGDWRFSGGIKINGCDPIDSEPVYTHPAVKQQQAEPVQAEPVADGSTSDGHHTFNELFDFRMSYNAALFNEWAAQGKHSVHKSYRHHTGELCFGGGYFVVVAVLPDGQISNHYKNEYWDLFDIPQAGQALVEFDNHTGAEVLSRLKSYRPRQAEPVSAPDDASGNPSY